MGNGTSIGKFNGLTTAGGEVFFDVGTLSRNASFLSRIFHKPPPERRLAAGFSRSDMQSRSQTGAPPSAFQSGYEISGPSRDPGTLGGNANGLIGNPDALSSNPDALSFDPDALSRDTDALSFDPDALRFDPDGLRFDPETLSFDVFHQRRGSNGLISSHLRGIASKPSKFGSFLLSRHYQRKGILPAFLINTVALARWLYGATVSSRFNGFFPSVSFPRIKAVETAAIQPGTHHTPLKQGVNEKAIHSKPSKFAFSQTLNIQNSTLN